MTYLEAAQLLSHGRVAQVCEEDLFAHHPSAGSIARSVVKSAGQMQIAVDEITTRLKQAEVLHADKPERGKRASAAQAKRTGCTS